MDDIETLDLDTSPEAKRASRGWRIAAVVSVVVAAVAVGVLISLLFGGTAKVTTGEVLACVTSRDFTEGADSTDVATCPPKGVKYIDGLVGKSEDGTFSLRPIATGKAGEPMELVVRKPDRIYIDVQHAQTHAALGQPVRVYTKSHEGQEIVVYMVDTPLLK